MKCQTVLYFDSSQAIIQEILAR
uniref:Uncharacterized protein n=1 Tax=Anguilla anguilla TaxID=7936 RepID=A0A0E9S3I9_ANGAN